MLDLHHYELEKAATKEYQVVHANYLSFLRQKAKISWLTSGDENTKVFHQSIKVRRQQSRIHGISNIIGIWVDEPNSVANAFLEYYQNLLGYQNVNRTQVKERILSMGPVLNQTQKNNLACLLSKHGM